MIGLPRSTYYRRPTGKTSAEADAPLAAAITAVRTAFPAYGYRRVTTELRRRGVCVNHKRVQRVMRLVIAIALACSSSCARTNPASHSSAHDELSASQRLGAAACAGELCECAL